MRKTLFSKDRPIDSNTSYYIVSDEPIIDMDYKDLLVLAIQKERASFRLYTGLAAIVKDNELNEILLSLAEEEARHMVTFEIEYGNLVSRKK